MSEKRFVIKKLDEDYCIFDRMNDDECLIYCDVERIAQECCNVLNEQQAIIEDLQKTNQEVLGKYLMLRLKIGELLNDE